MSLVNYSIATQRLSRPYHHQILHYRSSSLFQINVTYQGTMWRSKTIPCLEFGMEENAFPISITISEPFFCAQLPTGQSRFLS